MEDQTNSNPGSNEAKHPPGRIPASGTDSGSAAVPGGGTGNRGVGGIGTAGGTNGGDASKGSSGNKGEDDPNKLGPAGDYSR